MGATKMQTLNVDLDFKKSFIYLWFERALPVQTWALEFTECSLLVMTSYELKKMSLRVSWKGAGKGIKKKSSV